MQHANASGSKITGPPIDTLGYENNVSTLLHVKCKLVSLFWRSR